MFCSKCGAGLPDGTAFCPSCGNALTEGAQPAAQPTTPKLPLESFLATSPEYQKESKKLHKFTTALVPLAILFFVGLVGGFILGMSGFFRIGVLLQIVGGVSGIATAAVGIAYGVKESKLKNVYGAQLYQKYLSE